jgi:hypothetical protein
VAEAYPAVAPELDDDVDVDADGER